MLNVAPATIHDLAAHLPAAWAGDICRQTAEDNKAHPSSQWLDKFWTVVTLLPRESSRISPNPDQNLPQLLRGFKLIRLVDGQLASFNFCTSQHALTVQLLEQLSADAPCRLAEVGCMCMTDSASCQEGTGSKLGDAVAEALQAAAARKQVQLSRLISK